MTAMVSLKAWLLKPYKKWLAKRYQLSIAVHRMPAENVMIYDISRVKTVKPDGAR